MHIRKGNGRKSTGTVGRHYGWRSKIHLLSSGLEFLLRRFLSAHTASDESRLLKSQNEPYKVEECFIGPPKARQDLSGSIKDWLDDIGLAADLSAKPPWICSWSRLLVSNCCMAL